MDFYGIKFNEYPSYHIDNRLAKIYIGLFSKTLLTLFALQSLYYETVIKALNMKLFSTLLGLLCTAFLYRILLYLITTADYTRCAIFDCGHVECRSIR